MSNEDTVAIAEEVVALMDKNRDMSSDKHRKDHEFLDTLIVKNKKRTATFEAVRLHVLKYGALSMFTIILIAVWNYTKEHL